MTEEELDAAVDRLTELRRVSDYVSMAAMLPTLLPAVAYHGGGVALANTGYAASVCLRNLGYRDLALSAARVASAAAESVEHRPWVGATDFVRAHALPVESPRTTSRIVERSIDALQPGAGDPEVRQVLGQLHLTAALACAVDRRETDARSHLAEASKEAQSLGEPLDGKGFNLNSFGPTNVRLWRMNVEIELGNHGAAIELARRFTPGPLQVANRHQAYWLDLGRALAYSGRTDPAAVAALTKAERAAPGSFAFNPVARVAVMSIVGRSRGRTSPTIYGLWLAV
jgi:hypothetical protein